MSSRTRTSFHPILLSPSIWSKLPVELIREIFLFAASDNLLEARTLRLVSSSANIWVVPLLFHTVIFSDPNHITHFAATLLPKRKYFGAKSVSSATTCPLAAYAIDSLALAVATRVPSSEIALASVAPAFTRLRCLALTAQNLSSHAHWLRQHPIYPQQMMIFHFGRPHPVNFLEPVFRSVTHLHTSTLIGYRNSSVGDLPALTHLAVYSRIRLPGSAISAIAALLRATLTTLPGLRSLVLSLNGDMEPIWAQALRPCLEDRRFLVLPYVCMARSEWHDVVSGKKDIWQRAEEWNRLGSHAEAINFAREAQSAALIQGQRKFEWQMDLEQLDNFSERDVDPVEQLHRRTSFPGFAS